jgi:phospholipase C
LSTPAKQSIDPAPQSVREAGSLPYPEVPVGTVNEQMPFDHLVVVMMENHSFDNLLGALSRTRADVDGLSFDGAGAAMNSNPGSAGTPPRVTAFPLNTTAQGRDVSQSWKDTHEQIDGGAMNGFVRAVGSEQPMGYYTPESLPFAYSLAATFTLANRWFCSVPGPTYPNRRFLLAGTAFGGTATNRDELMHAFEHPPANGTIFKMLSEHGLSWRNYFSDIPMAMVLPRTIVDHPEHHVPIGMFFDDCRTGSLPAVSFLDPRIGALSKIGEPIAALPFPFKDLLIKIGADLACEDSPETQEDPQDMNPGEAWAHSVVEAVLQSPKWSRTLLIYAYDEHGGYYDHVPPPPAPIPDDIAPVLAAGDPSGGYDMYGPRVPAIVVSPYSRPGGVSNVVHDHTSVLATIEHKWNLPALTDRDANAATVMDFLDLESPAALLDPPPIQAPSETGSST